MSPQVNQPVLYLFNAYNSGVMGRSSGCLSSESEVHLPLRESRSRAALGGGRTGPKTATGGRGRGWEVGL